ncbi:MAG: TIR domain-containing protein [Sediminibacterium sp.]|nr:TIR domain-containing protein [Sediminibacterium sp.]
MNFFTWLFGAPKKDQRKKVFISFAIEDIQYRDYLVEQARKAHSPFDLIDMSVKKPWLEREWKWRCRNKINRCDAFIVLLGNNTKYSSGVKWEVKCAREARLPIRLMYIKKKGYVAIPDHLKGIKTMNWSWENLSNFLN